MEPDEEITEVTVLTVAEVAKTEVTRQVIALVFSVAATIATVWVAQKMQEPDFRSTLKMGTALMVKRWADRQAARFARLATHMANVYNGEKL